MMTFCLKEIIWFDFFSPLLQTKAFNINYQKQVMNSACSADFS